MVKGIFSILCIALSLQTLAQETKTKNLIVVTLDGLRWQEIFEGADPKILSQEKFVNDKTVYERFWSDSPLDRREKLMPFLWQKIGRQGQIYGNRNFNNRANCSNPHWFSYPGYSEMLLGFVDRRVKSNNPIQNPYGTVLDFIGSQPGFENRIGTFATWEVMADIVCSTSDCQMNAGDQRAEGKISDGEMLLNDLQEFMPNPHGARYDVFTFFYAFEYLKRSCPRVMFISFDETDEHAHGGRYDEYLKAAHTTDKMISKLWAWIQSQGDYKDQTTLLITTDHGRGGGSNHSWKNHGRLAFGSGQIWFAVIGPDTPALGEVKIESQYYQKQVAKTAAAFLGLNYTNVEPVGPVIKSMISSWPRPMENTIAHDLDFLKRVMK